MSKNYALKAQKRDRAGKGIARALRRENKTPAVIYGDGKEPVTIAIETKDANLEYNKGQMFTTVCDIDVDGEKTMVLARDVQLHPVSDNVLHVDFLRVNAKTTIVVDVPVQFINEDQSPGLQEKGILSVVRYSLQIRCKALNIPDSIVVDLAGKEQGETITINDATLPEGAVSDSDNENLAIGSVVAPKTMEQLEAEEAAEAAADEAAAAGVVEGAEGEGDASAEGGDDAAAEEEKSE